MWPEIERKRLLPSGPGDSKGRVPFISKMWVGFVYGTGVCGDDESGTMPHAMLINGVISVGRDVVEMYTSE